jgi:hypothetical protein
LQQFIDCAILNDAFFAGKEFRAVFISTVRSRHLAEKISSNQDGEFGFLSEHRLLNTALTRAKSWLGVVGDPVALCSIGDCSKIWIKYLKHCEKLGGVVPKDLKLEDIWMQTVTLQRDRNIVNTAADLIVRSHDSSVPISSKITAATSGLEKLNLDSEISLDGSWPALTGKFEKLVIGKQRISRASVETGELLVNSKETPLNSSVYNEQPASQSVQTVGSDLVKSKTSQKKKGSDIVSFKDWSLDYQLEPDEIIRQLAKVIFFSLAFSTLKVAAVYYVAKSSYVSGI